MLSFAVGVAALDVPGRWPKRLKSASTGIAQTSAKSPRRTQISVCLPSRSRSRFRTTESGTPATYPLSAERTNAKRASGYVCGIPLAELVLGAVLNRCVVAGDVDRAALADHRHLHLPGVLELILDLARDLVREQRGLLAPELGRHEPREVDDLERVLEHVLAVARPEAQPAEDLHELFVERAAVRLEHGLLARLADDLLELGLRLVVRLLDPRGMDAPVLDQ